MSTFRMWSCHLMPSIWRWQFMWYSQESWCIQRTKSMSLQRIEDCGVCGPLIHHLIIIITFIHIHLLPSAVLYTGTMNSLNIVPATDPDQPETLLLFSQYHHHHSDVGTFDCTVLLTISYTSQIYIYFALHLEIMRQQSITRYDLEQLLKVNLNRNIIEFISRYMQHL